MGLINRVVVNVRRQSAGPTQTGFGIPLVLTATAAWAERVRSYSSLAAVVDDFPITTSAEYLAAVALFAQEVKPPTIKFGRAANKPTQVYTGSLVAPVIGSPYLVTAKGKGVTSTDITITPLADVTVTSVTNGSDLFTTVAHGMATGDGPYRLTNSGGGLPAGSAVDTNYWIIRLSADTFSIATTYANAIALTAVNLTTDGTGTHTVQRDANDVMVAQLVDRLNSVVGNNYLAAQVPGAGDTDTFTVTGDAAGDWFSVKVDPNMVVLKQTHADPGVAADLIAINNVDTDWYELITLYNSNAYVLAAAAWIETQEKIYSPDSMDTDCVTAAIGGSDTIDDLHTLMYARTGAWYHNSPADMLAAAVAGRCLPIEPGGETRNCKELVGVNPVTLTDTQRTNLTNKAGNSYEAAQGVNATFDGTTADGDFFDATRGIDWCVSNVRLGIFRAQLNNDKIPFTNAGRALLMNEVQGVMDRAVSKGIASDDPEPVVEAPLVADVAPADKALRHYTGIVASFTLAGAVHKATVTLNVAT